MGHIASRDAYKNLEDRINWFTQGAPVTDTLTKILQVLYTEKEAKWVAQIRNAASHGRFYRVCPDEDPGRY